MSNPEPSSESELSLEGKESLFREDTKLLQERTRRELGYVVARMDPFHFQSEEEAYIEVNDALRERIINAARDLGFFEMLHKDAYLLGLYQFMDPAWLDERCAENRDDAPTKIFTYYRNRQNMLVGEMLRKSR